MRFNLTIEQWLPLLRRSGRREWVSPAHLTRDLADDPFVRPDWGRADFDAATLEFLIGLLATAYNPQDGRDWAPLWRAPPGPDALAEALHPLTRAFNLFGEGPRFMQELGGIAGEANGIAGLFIEAPGSNTEAKNTDLFQKRGRLDALSPAAVAMALYTLQTFAPSGGAGHRTSLRGGGPLTTLVLPRGDSLWARLWLNVPTGMGPLPEAGGGATVFPWLGATRSSEKGARPLGFEDMHSLSAFWWMPRRIVLDAPVVKDGACALTGHTVPALVTGYRTRPWGMNASGPHHPLSPMYRTKTSEAEWLFVHPQPGGLAYHHWVDLAFSGHAGALRRPAEIVTTVATGRATAVGGRPRLWAAGYDMDNMKARGFVEASFPLFLPEDPAALTTLEAHVRKLVAGAMAAHAALRSNVVLALGVEKTDGTLIGALSRQFYDQTEGAFFEAVEHLADALAKDPEDPEIGHMQGLAFLEKSLRPVALRLFDAAAPINTLGGREQDMQRIVKARRNLLWSLTGHDKGAPVFTALGLQPPEKPTSKPKTSSPEVTP